MWFTDLYKGILLNHRPQKNNHEVAGVRCSTYNASLGEDATTRTWFGGVQLPRESLRRRVLVKGQHGFSDSVPILKR